jgi:hypothetical protein
MSAMPPNMFNNEGAFQPPEVEAIEERERHEERLVELGDHEHGPGCGHEAVEHGDHVDYVQDGHRHWWHRDHWDRH